MTTYRAVYDSMEKSYSEGYCFTNSSQTGGAFFVVFADVDLSKTMSIYVCTVIHILNFT